jgi:glyoxylase I family protein
MWTQHHLHIRCRDILASRDFYINVLGAQEVRRYRTDYGLEIIFLTFKGTNLALSPCPDQETAPPAQTGTGIYQIAFQVENMEAALAGLQARGACLKGPVVSPHPGVKAAFIKAPDGVEIELMQY